MKKYRYLLWDIDGTILDFKEAEKAAVQSLFPKFGFGEISDERVEVYSTINDKYWKALERNEITKEEVLIGRYQEFFALEGIDPKYAEAFNNEYQLALGDTIAYCENADELLQQLKGKYILCAITNGTKRAQSKKLKASGLDQIFDYIFISDELGVEKPNPGFFDLAFEEMKLANRSQALIIGDSLTSDIRGGINAGVDTCWYNPAQLPGREDICPDYEIRRLNDILQILATS